MPLLFPLIVNAGCGTSLTDLNVPLRFTVTPKASQLIYVP